MEMKCIQVSEIGSFQITQAPVPEPDEAEVMIQVEVTGLCRTDLKLIRVGHRDLVMPRIPGEEVVGIVTQTGPGVDTVKEGDRAYVYPGVWCGECAACRSGAENLCREMRIMGFHRDGGFAQYVKVPAQSIIQVPDGLEPDLAVFAEPLSCCLNALELGGTAAGKTIGIWGAGPAGTLLSRAATALGATPSSIDPDPNRQARIDGFAACPDLGFDICIVAVGDRQAYEEALAHLNPRGSLVVFSGLPPADNTMPVSFNQLHYHEQTLVGAYGCCYRHGVAALEFLAGGNIVVKDMISHRMSLYELDEALDMVAHRKGMKILLYP
jgi:L-iditol 2-dehydrogenase